MFPSNNPGTQKSDEGYRRPSSLPLNKAGPNEAVRQSWLQFFCCSTPAPPNRRAPSSPRGLHDTQGNPVKLVIPSDLDISGHLSNPMIHSVITNQPGSFSSRSNEYPENGVNASDDPYFFYDIESEKTKPDRYNSERLEYTDASWKKK